jgi:hypothetical protein
VLAGTDGKGGKGKKKDGKQPDQDTRAKGESSKEVKP